MTQYLPPNLLALFAPREPMPFKQPAVKLVHEKKRAPYTGVAEYVTLFESPEDVPEPEKAETKDERRERRRKEKTELQAYKIEQGIALWNASQNARATSDPYKTLFVGRLHYDISESKLRRELEAYGPVKKVYMIQDAKTGKNRGYGFVEFEKERDMHAAYKHADGRKISDRRVLVDVERGRTVKGWLPRRLGGGLGNTRVARPKAGERDADLDRSRRPDDRRGGGGGGGGYQHSSSRGAERPSERDRDRDRGDRDRSDRERSSRPRRSRSRERSSRRSDAREPTGGRDAQERPRDRDRGDREPRDRDRERRDRDREPRDREREREPRDREREREPRDREREREPRDREPRRERGSRDDSMKMEEGEIKREDDPTLAGYGGSQYNGGSSNHL